MGSFVDFLYASPKTTLVRKVHRNFYKQKSRLTEVETILLCKYRDKLSPDRVANK